MMKKPQCSKVFYLLSSCLRELNDSETEDNVSLRKEAMDSLEVSGGELLSFCNFRRVGKADSKSLCQTSSQWLPKNRPIFENQNNMPISGKPNNLPTFGKPNNPPISSEAPAKSHLTPIFILFTSHFKTSR